MSFSWLSKQFRLPTRTEEHRLSNQNDGLVVNSNSLASIPDDIYVDEVSEADMQVVVINRHSESDALAKNPIEHGKTHGTLNGVASNPKNSACSSVITEYRMNKSALAERLLFWIDVPQMTNASTRGGLRYFNLNDCEQYIYADDSRIKRWEKIKDMVMEVEVFEPSLPEHGESWHRPEIYITACFFWMSNIKPDTILTKLKAMRDIGKIITDPAFPNMLRPRSYPWQHRGESTGHGSQ